MLSPISQVYSSRLAKQGVSNCHNLIKLILVLSLLFPAGLSQAQNLKSKIDSLYIVLDSTIARIPQVIEAKERRISNLTTDLVSARTDEQRYAINSQLYYECCKYNYDKAMMFISNNLQLADKNHNTRWRNESLLRQSKLLVSTIAFKEAGNILDEINPAKLEPDLLRSYYSIRQLYYFYLIEFSDKYYLSKYREEFDTINSKLISLANTTEDISREYEFQYSYCRAQPDTKSKLDAYLKLISRLTPDNPYYGATAASISNFYNVLHDKDNWVFYLLKAAISDLSIATKEHSALQELAFYLSENGDVTRAYKYIDISMQDALAFNARHRIMDASSKFLIIQSAYKHKEDAERQTLRLTLIISFIIIGIILFFVIYIRRQSHKILVAYKNLNEIHSKFKIAMTMLQQMSASKDNYLVKILTLSSSFFKKQSDFKKLLYKKIISGKTEDIYKTLKTSLNDDQDLETFYKLFDSAVCDLFPGFVEKVNSLFVPGKQIEIKSERDLNAELRILALIRLGITDNTQMSNFLNYSIGTIYTYRSKLRNNAKDSANFEHQVAKIDSIEIN